VTANNKINLLDLSVAKLTEFVQEQGEPAYRALQLVQWVHKHGVSNFAQMTNLSKNLRDKLSQMTTVTLPEVSFERASSDGTHKWLLRLHDGNVIETVYIPETTRGTLCISSQAGCALNCSFCSTGKEGFNRNLTLAEIIGQVWLAVRALEKIGKPNAVTNVVLMGMGEPLLNYDNVLAAIQLMLSDHAYNLSKYRVTLSTSGVVPAMLRLKQDSSAALAVSLHAPNNELRNELVPINKKYPLEQLMPLCRDYFPKNSKRVVTFEYVMLHQVNDSLTHAKQLIRLLDNMPGKVNLIPFNPFPGSNYQTSTPEAVALFQQRLMGAGIQTWVRKRRGDDIDAACGQLAGQIQDRTGRHQRWLRTGKLIPIVVEQV